MKQAIFLVGLVAVVANLSSSMAIALTKPAAVAKTQKLAQAFSPGTATRGGRSYIGVGGNIGLGGDRSLNEGAFAIITKIGLSRNLSVRPSALVKDNAVFLIPVTFDFSTQPLADTPQQRINVAPYLGLGAIIATGNNEDVGFLLNGGVDIPLSSRLTANASVNVGFLNDTEAGLLLGVGYNF